MFLVDADRQIPLDAFGAAWAELAARGTDVVLGARRGRNDPRHRLLLTRLVRWTLVFLFGVRIFDANVPYKLFRRTLWDEARALIPDDSLMPTLCFAVYARKTGRKVTEIEVVHRARTSGTGSLRPVKLAVVCARTLRQLLTFRRRLNQSLRQRARRGS